MNLLDFNTLQLFFILLIFVWSGFVRSGLGFGGASLSLPLLLLIYDQPIYWIPIIGLQLLFFSALTLKSRWFNIDWIYLKGSSKLIVPSAIAGVFGLINLSNDILLFLIYGITIFYAVLWMFNKTISSQNIWLNKFLLLLGGYVSGATLSGATLITAVFTQNVELSRLRSTLFIVWTCVVLIKLSTLLAYGISLQFKETLYLLPIASLGHIMGLKSHEYLMAKGKVFTRVIGTFLLIVCLAGFWKIWQNLSIPIV